MDRAVNLQITDRIERLKASNARRLKVQQSLIDKLERLIDRKNVRRPSFAANSLGIALN